MTGQLFVLLTAAANCVLIVWLVARSRGRERHFDGKFRYVEDVQEKIERSVKDEIARSRQELGATLKLFEDSLLCRINENENYRKNQLDTFANQLSVLTQMNEQKLENLRDAVEGRLKSLQDENSRKLEEMRLTVDEKLHTTLERRLNEKFKIVSDSLQMFGAYGYSQDMPLERMLRDVRMFQIGGGTSQAQLNMIARSIFKRKFDLRK